MTEHAGLGQKVAVWARSKKGQQFGAGECWDLADRALRQAGARSSDTTAHGADYEWGRAIELTDIQSGDILQFRDFFVRIRSDKETTMEDGSTRTSWSEETHGRAPTHTAIVDRVMGGGAIVVLEQHVKPLGKRVQTHTIYVSNTVLPPRTVHSRSKQGHTARDRPIKIKERVSIVVSGVVRAYRPIPT